MLDHFIFASTKRSRRSKLIWFTVWTGAILGSFWWFKDLALGVRGPINEHKGWAWRPSWNVSLTLPGCCDRG